MPKNIREVCEDRDNLLAIFNRRLQPAVPEEAGGSHRRFSYFDGSKLGSPVVVEDDLTKRWLEINYLFSTGFRPNHRAGVGEIGADIRKVKELDGEKYLTVHFGLLDGVVRALSDFRAIEEVYAGWLNSQESYEKATGRLYKKVKSLSRQHPQLAQFKEIFERATGYIGWQYIGLPAENFVSELENLSIALKDLSEKETSQEASRLSQGLKPYSAAIPQLSKIRKYHKNVPYISSDNMIKINTPAASGGLCLHTHPGSDDPYVALPSEGDLVLIAAECGTLPNVVHVGGGETTGEHYIMHIPRKFFFDEVKAMVDKEGVTDETKIIQIKQEVFNRRLDDLMTDEILGFKIDGNNGKRIAVLSPVVTCREYERHRSYLEAKKLAGQSFGVKEVLLDVGNAYARYLPTVTDFLAKKVGRLFSDEKRGLENA